jgi:hypothetical protein
MTTTALAHGDVDGAAVSADAVVTQIETDRDRILGITDAQTLAAEAHAFADQMLAAPGDLAAAQRAGKEALATYANRMLAVAIASSRLSEHLDAQHEVHIDPRDDAFLTMLGPYLAVQRAWEEVHDPAKEALDNGKINGAKYEARTALAREIKNRTIRKCSEEQAQRNYDTANAKADRAFRLGKITAAERARLRREAEALRVADLAVIPYRPRDVRQLVGATGSMVNYVRGNAPHDQSLWPDVDDALEVARREFRATDALVKAKDRIDREVRYVSFRTLRAAPFNVPNTVIAELTGTSEARTSQIMNYTR